MTYDDNRDEGEIKRRAAWLLVMLAVVAVLIVVVMVFFLGGSKGSNDNAAPDPNYGNDPSTSASQGASPSTGSGDTSRPGSPSPTTSSASSTSSGPVPKASCPSNATCTVAGDIGGAVTAINALRADHDLSPVQAKITSSADQCALSSGSDCPQSYVWVHVDNLSGDAVVSAVQGFSGTDNLLDAGATTFAIGWAYDPGSDSSYCAVIRVS